MMAAGSQGSGHGADQDFDLNLAPIIDCFTVLITFMLASATFLSIGILDAGITAAGAAGTPSSPPPINVSIDLKRGNTISLKVTGKENRTLTFAPKNGSWDHAALAAELSAIKSRWPAVDAATLSGDDSVEYQDIVKSMEITRKTLPAVLLGGF